MAWQWIQRGEVLRARAQETVYQPLMKGMRERVDYWKKSFSEDPSRNTGWGHNYICPKCAGPLDFDRDKPLEHRCPACGIAVENTPKILEAWTYYRRFELGAILLDAALLYRMYGDEADKAFVLDTISYYADHYAEYDEYGAYAGRGKVMGQSLDEAVWGIALLKALMALDFDGKSELGQRLHSRLFLPAARLVMAQSGMIHNIPLWHAAFATGAGLFFGDERLVQQSAGGDLGARNQILKGFTEDGLWYENSTGYHTYALTAATNACLFARYAGVDDPEVFARVIGGYTSLLKLRFRDDTFPAFNDSGRSGTDKGLRGQLDAYLAAAHLFEGMPGAEEIAAAIVPYDTAGLMADFLYGKPRADGGVAPFGSVLLAHNCMGVLRSEAMEVYAKYGNLLRSHAHADALQINIPPFVRDPGTSGYGSPFHQGWYTTTAAHSTFTVDGQTQRYEARGEGSLSPDGKTFSMSVPDAYEGVWAGRRLTLEGATLLDEMTVRCERPRQIDWLLHGVEDFTFEGEASLATLPETENGYQYFTDIRRVRGAFSASYAKDGKTLRVTFEALTEDAQIYLARTPDYPATCLRHTILVRQTGKEAVVKARYTIEE